jgi:hypothetical protein
MGRSSTRFINFQRIGAPGNLASTILRLMMACNDQTLVDDALAAWHRERSDAHERRAVGAKMYFVRLQIAHVFEALSIIQTIRDTSELADAVSAYDVRTRGSFDKIANFIDTDDYKKMVRIRNNITFHYDEGAVAKAFREVAAEHPDLSLHISMGDETIDWFFEPADRIIDRIVVRDIFAVPREADVRAEVDNIVVRLHDVVKAFADFAGYFIWHHTRR